MLLLDVVAAAGGVLTSAPPLPFDDPLVLATPVALSAFLTTGSGYFLLVPFFPLAASVFYDTA